MLRLLAAAMILASSGPAAWAETRIVAKPGIMCKASAALATLTLPGGDSRTHRPFPKARDLAVAKSGGCRDLEIGERLSLLEAFRNTAIVVPGGTPPDTPHATFVVPTIDLAPMPKALPGPDNHVAIDPMSDARTHPGGTCARTSPGLDRCVYPNAVQADCPVPFRCKAAIYGFRDGHLASFQTALVLESDWRKAFRLASKRYAVSRRMKSAAGESTFFHTGSGVLGFGRSFATAPGNSPVWAIRFFLPVKSAGE